MCNVTKMYRYKKVSSTAGGVVWCIYAEGTADCPNGARVLLEGPKGINGKHDTGETVENGKFSFELCSGSDFSQGKFRVVIEDCCEGKWMNPTQGKPPKKGWP